MALVVCEGSRLGCNPASSFLSPKLYGNEGGQELQRSYHTLRVGPLWEEPPRGIRPSMHRFLKLGHPWRWLGAQSSSPPQSWPLPSLISARSKSRWPGQTTGSWPSLLGSSLQKTRNRVALGTVVLMAALWPQSLASPIQQQIFGENLIQAIYFTTPLALYSKRRRSHRGGAKRTKGLPRSLRLGSLRAQARAMERARRPQGAQLKQRMGSPCASASTHRANTARSPSAGSPMSAGYAFREASYVSVLWSTAPAAGRYRQQGLLKVRISLPVLG